MTTQNIADGVRFCSVKTDKFKTCRVNISLAMPLDKSASARAILPFMFSRRCAKYPDFTSLNRVLDGLYGASVSAGILKRGEAQILSFSMTAIDDRFALDGDKVAFECAQLLAEMIFDPLTEGKSFPEDIIEQEKRLLVETIENEQNDKRRYAMLRCEQLMFADEAYGINRLGSVDEVKALTPADVYSAWRDVLEKATVQITMASSMDPQPVAELIKDKFSEIERNPVEIKTQFVSGLPKPEYVCETMPLKQGKLVMGFSSRMHGDDGDSLPLMVMTDIFGGGPYSRLFDNVREKMSLCYYCSASSSRVKGLITVESGVEEQNAEKAEKAISEQLEIMKKGEFTDFEFSSSVKSLRDSLNSYNDSQPLLDLWYALKAVNKNLYSPEDIAEKISAVTRDEIIAAANGVKLHTVYKLLPKEEK